MFARKLSLKQNGIEIGTTPMFIPSISSRITIPINEILVTIKKLDIPIGPFLISAYDLNYTNISPIEFPELLFIDSGGFECLNDRENTYLGLYDAQAKKWTREMHTNKIKEFINERKKWSTKPPLAIVSYDHPDDKERLENQISKAEELFSTTNNSIKELLIKAEPGTDYINVDIIKDNINSLNRFDIIGFTEKELGYSLYQRMSIIAKIRLLMDSKKICKPIHIFGSLDTVTTPLYYFAGADIFDGLSWLRFVYDKESTYYGNSYAPRKYGAEKSNNNLFAEVMNDNYTYLLMLKNWLIKYYEKGTFDQFGNNSEFFKFYYEKMITELGVGN